MKGLIVLGLILLVIILFFIWYYFCGFVGEIKKAKPEFEIFGLDDGFVPQGICYNKEYGKFLLSGYNSIEGCASKIYVVDEKTKTLEKSITLVLKNGKPYMGHGGGIACYKKYGFISSEGEAFVFTIADIFTAKLDQIHVNFSFKTQNNADFCFVYNELLYVGEFYKLGKFKTDVSHHIKLEDGTIHHSLVLGYDLCEIMKMQETLEPVKAISVGDEVQGIAVHENKIFMSSSYGLLPSKLYEHKNVLSEKTQKYIILKEKKVPLYELSAKTLRKTTSYPEMMEEIEVANGKLFMVFESGAKKYRLFTRTTINKVFSKKIKQD